MDNQMQIAETALEPNSKILVLMPSYYSARIFTSHLVGCFAQLKAGFVLQRAWQQIDGPYGQSVRIVPVGRSAQDTLRDLSGLYWTNIFYSRDLHISLDELLWGLRSRMRHAGTFAGVMTIEPLITGRDW